MDLPPGVRRFILVSVPDVPYLEALLLLRTDADATWDARRVAQRLFVGEKRAQGLLEALVAGGIAQPSGTSGSQYHYRPRSPDLAALLDEVAAVYASNLVGVTKLIHSRADKQAQQFADAFRLRKDS